MPFAANDPILEPTWLRDHIDDPKLVILDCRLDIRQPETARLPHLPQAHLVDLNRDLADPPRLHGGRHPIPDTGRFGKLMRSWGVHPDSTVVAYDADGQASARLWWLMNYFGHTHTYILNGGINAWQAMGGALSLDPPKTPEPGTFTAHPDPEMTTTHSHLLDPAPGRVLVDARSRERFRGEQDPLDTPPGHIPGAVNRFWQETLVDGRYPEAEILQQRFEDFSAVPDLIAYCGSGITACVNIAGMRRIGLTPKLYPGSWSDWITYPDHPIARGEHP